MRRLRILHETEYSYTSDIQLGDHRLLVRPRDGHDIRIEASRLEISPNGMVSWHRDELDNSVALVTFGEDSVRRLKIVSEVTVAHYSFERQTLPLTENGSAFPVGYSDQEASRLSSYLEYPVSEALNQWLQSVNPAPGSLGFLTNLCQSIYENFTYCVRIEEGVQSPDETLSAMSGSCRDYAWLFVCAARQSGFAARFVSGYFHTAGTSLVDGHTHAWVEIYLPGAGWTGFDPTCNRLTAENHIPVAVAVNPEDIPPVSGSFRGTTGEGATLEVRVRVTAV